MSTISTSDSPAVAALLALGRQYHTAGDLKAAAAQYGTILAQVHNHAEVLYLSGAVDYQTGASEQAYRKLEKSLAIRPGYMPAIEMLGAVATQTGRLEQAVQCFETSIAQNPAPAGMYANLGTALFHIPNYAKAIAALREAVKRDPKHVKALYLLANALRLQGEFLGAAGVYKHLTALEPNHAHALDEYGGVLYDLGQRAEAEKIIRRAIAAAPERANPYTNLGRIYQGNTNTAAQALQLHDQALALAPQHADAHNNRGAALHMLSRFDEAIESFNKALSLKPTLASAYNNLGTALTRVGDIAGARQQYDKAVALKPDYAEGHMNIAILQLSHGEFREGWEGYEWRWKCKEMDAPTRAFPFPHWQGQDLNGDTLLVWGHQGLGDQILYGSMIGELVDRGMKIKLEISPRLVTLFQNTYPSVSVYARSDPPHPELLESSVRVQCAVDGLGRFLRPDVASFARARRSYLHADAARTQGFRDRLLSDGTKRVIGVSWASKNDELGIHKTSALTAWKPIWDAAGPHTKFVNLQYGDTQKERSEAALSGMPLTHLDDLDLIKDIDGLAALVGACDLVISISNTNAHFAGALGVPVWVMVPAVHGNLWYWGAGEGQSLWYPSATTFRPKQINNWSEAIARIAQKLAETA